MNHEALASKAADAVGVTPHSDMRLFVEQAVKWALKEAALSAAEPVAAMTTDYLGCEYVSMDVAGIEKIAAAHSKGPTKVVYLYAAPPAPSVAVKALEWQKQAMSHGYGLFIRLAKTSIGDYQISHGAAGKYEVYLNKDPISASYDSVHEAKAVAKADFEARIISALSAQVQDVAGWQDISTIEPKDGMIVMGWGEYRERDGFSPAFMRWYESVGGWSVSAMPFYPTHWMPLPAAPAKQEGGK